MNKRLKNILESVGNTKVLLVGDFMLDRYTYGNINRISPEAPAMILKVIEKRELPGGAGSVAIDLATLGVEIRCVGIVGKEDNGLKLLNLLETNNININSFLTVDDRPTTVKERVVGVSQHYQQQIIRIDEEICQSFTAFIYDKLFQQIKKYLDWCDIICLQDYNKGIFYNNFCHKIITIAKKYGKKTLIDSASIKNYKRYQNAWLIKPNREELEKATQVHISDDYLYEKAAKFISHRYNIKNIIVTLDKQGVFYYQKNTDIGEFIPTYQRNVYDVTGAGDMFLSILGLLIGGTYSGTISPTFKEILYLANVASGLEVEKFGYVGISKDEIISELSHLNTKI